MSRFTGIRRLLAAAAVGTLALALAPGAGAGAGGDAVRAAAASCTANRSVQMVEANIKSGMTAAQTRADLAKAYADKPDFVALNEVAGRSDGVLAPAGYALFRTPGRYTGSNVVTWRTDRWIAKRAESKDPAFRNSSKVTDEEFDRLIRNVYKVLMTRGMIGTLLFSTDAETNAFLRSLI